MHKSVKLKPKYLNDKNDPWMLAENIPGMDFHFSQIWLSAFANDLQKTVGINYKKVLSIYHGYDLKFYYGFKDSDDFAKHILSLIIDNPSFGEKINKEIRRYSIELKRASASLDSAGLAAMSDSKLAVIYSKLNKLHTTLYTWGWLPNAVDMFHDNFTGYLKDKLSERVKFDKISEVLVALSFSAKKSVIDEEQNSFLALVALKQAGKNKEFTVRFKKHLAKYFYLKYLWIGKDGVYDAAYYLSEVEAFIFSGLNAANTLEQKERQRQFALNKKRQLIRKLKINGKLLRLFNIYAEFSVTKVFRRDAQLLWSYKMGILFKELSKRWDLPVKFLRFMSPAEVIDTLKKGKINERKVTELKSRSKNCVCYAEKDISLVFTGKAVKRWKKKVTQIVDSDLREIKGQVACLGKVIGIARIVNSVADMKKLKQGEVLVSIATNPDVVPAMKIAAAIVTEQGGITSHAAIVSRELNIPCIIGTKIATQVLKDGDLVEVDAEKGAMRVIKRGKLRAKAR
jgi:phosphohistidine swiveling domain-containing protein